MISPAPYKLKSSSSVTIHVRNLLKILFDTSANWNPFR
jgi:hypothetical protein